MGKDIRNSICLSKNDTGRPADGGEIVVQDCGVKPPLPCIVILVHGVNDVGEAYENQDTGICAGLNDRLGREDLHPHEWKTHEFMISDVDGRISTKTCSVTDQTCVGEVNRSPVIPFYWGYKPVDHAAFKADQQRYRDELKKKHNEADLPYDTYQQDDARIIKNHDNQNIDNLNNWLDPASAKGGGTFANATTCIPDMFGPGASGLILEAIARAKSRSTLNKEGDWSHPIYQNPHRIYQAYAARRLADLIIAIRQNPETKFDTINIVAHSQGTIITMLANMWVKAEEFEPADCVILNHSPYSLENRWMENFMPGKHQTDIGRQKTIANFCKLMSMNSNYSVSSFSHEADYIEKLMETGCLSLTAHQTLWKDPRYNRNNFGRVYNYFCPNDQTVSLEPIQGFGWRGVPDKIKATLGSNFHQRSFCKDLEVGDKSYFHFQMPPKKSDDPKYNPKYSWNDVTVDAPILPESFTFKLMAQGEGYKARLSGNDPAIARAAMKAERFINVVREIPNGLLFSYLRDGDTLNELQLTELRNEFPEWEILSGKCHALNDYVKTLVLSRRMTDAELDQAVQLDVSYSQHSSIVASIEVSRKSTTYDLAIGQCRAFEFKDFWDELLLQADWRRPNNPDPLIEQYYQTGILNDEKIKQFMNKPERKKGIPTGELGVFNDYGRSRPVGISPYGVGYVEIMQWDMPKPLI